MNKNYTVNNRSMFATPQTNFTDVKMQIMWLC